MQAGAKAYLLKDSPRAQLLESIRGVYSGRLSIPPAIGALLAAHMQSPKLSKRETDVTKLMMADKSNKEIGASLGVAESTVKVHIGHILKKLGAAGRTEAIRMALQRGIVHLASMPDNAFLRRFSLSPSSSFVGSILFPDVPFLVR
jgi:two-component system, NarL family, response regulator